MSLLQDISRLILNTGVDLYIVVLWVRFLLQATGADFYNPISQFAFQATHRLVDPLDRLFQRKPPAGVINIRRKPAQWSFGALLLIVLIKLLQIALTSVLVHGAPPTPLIIGFVALLNFPSAGDIVFSLSGLLPLLLRFYLYAIIAGAILSWVAADSPAVQTLFRITEPVLAPCRRLLPAMSGIDFSPIIALLGLQIAEMVLSRAVFTIAQIIGIA